MPQTVFDQIHAEEQQKTAPASVNVFQQIHAENQQHAENKVKPERGFWDKVWYGTDEEQQSLIGNARGGVIPVNATTPDQTSAILRGGEKGLTETLAGASQLAGRAARKIGLQKEDSTGPKGIFGEPPPNPEEVESHGFLEHLGSIGEGTVEFIAGDEALKGLSIVGKLKELKPVLELAQKYPRLATILKIGGDAVRRGTVAGTQDEVKGGDFATGAAVGAGSSALGDLTAAGISKIAPKVKQIAGQIIPVRASQDSGVARAAELIAHSDPLERFDIEQTQPAAKSAIGNISTSVRNAAAAPLQPRPPVPPSTAFANRVPQSTDAELQAGLRAREARMQMGSTAATIPDNLLPRNPITEKIGSQSTAIPQRVFSERTPPTWEPPSPKPLARVGNPGEAADSIRQQSRPIFQKLDELSGGEFSKAQDAEQAARRKGDFDLVRQSRTAQYQLFDQFKGKFPENALQQAKSGWRQASALDSLQDAINKSTHPTPAEFAKEGGPDPGYINGKQFRERLLDLNQSGELKDALRDPKHIQDIQDIGRLLENGNNVRKLSTVSKTLWYGLRIAGAAVSGNLAYAGGMTAEAGAEYAVSRTVAKAMTDPKLAHVLADGLRNGATPAALTSTLMFALRQSRRVDEGSTLPTK